MLQLEGGITKLFSSDFILGVPLGAGLSLAKLGCFGGFSETQNIYYLMRVYLKLWSL